MSVDAFLFAIVLVLAIAASLIVCERLPARLRAPFRSASALYFFLALSVLLGSRFPGLAHGLAVFVCVLAAALLALALTKAFARRGFARARLAAAQSAAALVCCLCAIAIVTISATTIEASALLFAAAGLLGSVLAIERLSRPIVDRGGEGYARRAIGR